MKKKMNNDFIAFARHLISQRQTMGKKRMAEAYSSAVNSLEHFLGGKDIPTDQLDPTQMTAFETYLRARGLCANTTSFYMRNLRAIYNQAVDCSLSAQRFPFKHVYTGVDKTRKRAVTIDTIRQLKSTDLSQSPTLDRARDLFMFSFYTRGMSFVDMAFLRKDDLRGGFLTYRRKKTGHPLTIRWEHLMQEIVDKYADSSSPYLLPIIRGTDKDARRQYLSELHRVNRHLKTLGQMLHLEDELTSYVARHAWASIAKSKRIALATISEAMGHSSENVTRIYLTSFDTSAVDQANRMILDDL